MGRNATAPRTAFRRGGGPRGGRTRLGGITRSRRRSAPAASLSARWTGRGPSYWRGCMRAAAGGHAPSSVASAGSGRTAACRLCGPQLPPPAVMRTLTSSSTVSSWCSGAWPSRKAFPRAAPSTAGVRTSQERRPTDITPKWCLDGQAIVAAAAGRRSVFASGALILVGARRIASGIEVDEIRMMPWAWFVGFSALAAAASRIPNHGRSPALAEAAPANWRTDPPKGRLDECHPHARGSVHS